MAVTETTSPPGEAVSCSKRLASWLVPTVIIAMAIGLVLLISGNWTTWAGEREEQTTGDAYLRADLTSLSTKGAGLVASVEIADYQAVKGEDLLVRLRADDFRDPVRHAEAMVGASESAVVSHQRQKEHQDARVLQAQTGIAAGEADIAAAEAGIEAANATAANARSGLAGTEADVQRASLGSPAARRTAVRRQPLVRPFGASRTPWPPRLPDISARVGLLSAQVRAQANTMASSYAFLLIAWSIVAYLLLLVFLRPGTIDLRHAGKTQ